MQEMNAYVLLAITLLLGLVYAILRNQVQQERCDQTFRPLLFYQLIQPCDCNRSDPDLRRSLPSLAIYHCAWSRVWIAHSDCFCIQPLGIEYRAHVLHNSDRHVFYDHPGYVRAGVLGRTCKCSSVSRHIPHTRVLDSLCRQGG